MIVVLIVAIYFNVVDDRNDDLDATVILCAQNEVSKILKSASTAHWGAGEILDKDQFDRYLVYIPLEAQNGFGAYSKSYFLVIVSDVTLDGQYTFMTFGSRLEIVNFTNASVPSVVTDYKNGEIAPIVQNFLENNRWGEDPDKET